MADYKISVAINGDSTSFQRAFAKANQTVEDFDKRTKSITQKINTVGNSFTSVGGKLTKGITTPAISAATALTSLTLVKGFNRLTGIDDAKAKLKGLGHDAKNVEKIMNSALASVKGTSYGMDEAATTAASAVAAGIKPGKELTRYLSLTADAASIAGVSMSDMGSIINKVQTSQVAYTDNLNQLADRGIPIYQWLADEAKVSASEVKDMAKDGEISSEMFLKAIEKNIGGAAKVFGENSFKASIANIGASISRIGANFLDAGGKGGGFFSTLKPLLVDFNNRLGTIENKAAELGAKFGQAFDGVVQKVQGVISKFDAMSEAAKAATIKSAGIGTAFAVGLGPGITALGKGINTIAAVSGGLNSITSGVSKSLLSLPKTFSTVGTELGKFAADFKILGSGILQPFGDIGKAIGKSKLGTKFHDFFAALSKVSQTGSKLVGYAFKGLVNDFSKAHPKLTSVFQNISGNFNSLFEKLSPIKDKIGTVFGNVQGKFGEYAGKIGSGLQGILQRSASFAPAFLRCFNIAAGIGIVFAGLGLLQAGFGDKIDSILQTVTDKGPHIITNLCAGIVTKLPDLIAQGGELVDHLLGAVIANLPALLAGGTGILATLVSSIAGQLPTLIPTALDLILTLVNGLILNLPKLVTSGLTLIQGLVTGLVNAIPKLINAAPKLITNLIIGIVHMLPQIITTGITLITQLVVGLIQAIPKLIEAVPQIIDSLKDAFSDFDWGSIGKNIINGIKDGLSAVASNLVQSAKDAGRAALDGIKDVLGIHSPSRVFRDEVGRMMGIGLGIGFENNIPVKSMSGNVADAVKKITGDTISLSADIGGKNLSGANVSMLEDVSLDYAKASAANNSCNSSPFDITGLGEYIISAVTRQSEDTSRALKEGISSMKLIPNDREAQRYLASIKA